MVPSASVSQQCRFCHICLINRLEEAVEWTFHKGFETFGGKSAVGDSPLTGREVELERDNRRQVKKDKEL